MTDRDSLAAMLNMVDAIREQDWTEQAACRGSDPDSFFPDSYIVSPQVLAICEACPVKLECGEAGMNERYGLWGGKSEHDRKKIRRQQRKEGVA